LARSNLSFSDILIVPSGPPCYVFLMKNKLKKKSGWKFETAVLVTFAGILVAAIISAFASANMMRNTIASNNDVINADMNALIEVERIRTLAEVKTASARAYFLLGSSALYDEQKQKKQDYETALAKFEKEHSYPQVPEIMKKLMTIEQQHQEFFDQAVKFREQKTESKIVGQFFQSKTSPLRSSINAAMDEIVKIANDDLARARAVPAQVESQVVKLMTWFTGLMVFLVSGLMLLVLRMVYQRSKHQAERDRLFEGAKKAHQARDELMVAIANDLKTPLNDIAQSAESITGSTETANVGDSIESIKRSVSMTENTIKDILDQAKADEGNLALRLDQLGVNEFLADARFMLEPMARKHDVRLQIDAGNPPVLAFFDRERILRVLSNLVGNAVKFSPKHSKVTVRVRSDQQFAYISVTDSGPGIPEKHRSEIFDKYWQAPKTADLGTGVGLSIVKTIIEAHGGTVKVESQPGNGSTFTFSLPRRRPTGAVLSKPIVSIKSTSRLPTQEM
jgi:signal transduction histidine kinase